MLLQLYLDCVVPRIPAVRLLVDDRTSLRELARLVLLPDLPPADSRSNTLTVPPLAVGFGDSLLGREEIRSMIELLENFKLIAIEDINIKYIKIFKV